MWGIPSSYRAYNSKSLARESKIGLARIEGEGAHKYFTIRGRHTKGGGRDCQDILWRGERLDLPNLWGVGGVCLSKAAGDSEVLGWGGSPNTREFGGQDSIEDSRRFATHIFGKKGASKKSE